MTNPTDHPADAQPTLTSKRNASADIAENTNRKRPASHRWAIGFYSFMAFGFSFFLFKVFSGRDGASPMQYWVEIFVIFFAYPAVFALLFGGRNKWAYLITTMSLGVWSCRATYVSLLYIFYFFAGNPGLNRPYFHLMSQEQPFIVQQHVSAFKAMSVPIMTGFLILLFYRFSFGQPSRRYFGISDTGSDESAKSDKTTASPEQA